MRLFISIFAFLSTLAFAQDAPITPGPWEHTADSLPQKGVPKGELKGPFEFRSKIFEGTLRYYWVFVPAQYKQSDPASVLVFQDGQRAITPNGHFRLPNVMDNLIHKGEMPVTIGIFIMPGHKGDAMPENYNRFKPNNRAFEYDSVSDHYARFLIEEMLPEVGKDYNLTDDPEERAIGGSSSGAICAFSVAWHRPDHFRKVISFIGSYVSIRFRPEEDPIKLGGQDYPALIRREPIRPIKIFLQDGSNDLDNRWGNWFLANLQMEAAFNYANRTADEANTPGPRYQVKSIWTDGKHSGAHGGAMLPDVLRWLWSE
ncbi:MAG: alpha/beta hydrolase-fold protein [Verrucomicrobiota bacterium]